MTFGHARFSVARTPVDGIIRYKRFAGDPDYEINFPTLEAQFGWTNCVYLNDLEAGAHGANHVGQNQLKTLIQGSAEINQHKVLISVGTGVGHAGMMDGHILRTAGGHHFPVTVTHEHRDLESFVRTQKGADDALIMEDFVSARGLRTIAAFISKESNDRLSNAEFMAYLKNYPDATRLFYELLGLYAQNLVSIMGFYGGVYITGGVIDYLIKYDLADWNSFRRFARPADMTSVFWRFETVPVHYVLHDELPLLGLTTL